MLLNKKTEWLGCLFLSSVFLGVLSQNITDEDATEKSPKLGKGKIVNAEVRQVVGNLNFALFNNNIEILSRLKYYKISLLFVYS